MGNDIVTARGWNLWWTPSLRGWNSPIAEPRNRSELSPLSRPCSAADSAAFPPALPLAGWGRAEGEEGTRETLLGCPERSLLKGSC